MPDAGFTCYKCQEHVRSDLQKDEVEPSLFLAECPGCRAINSILNPGWGPQALNAGQPVVGGEPAEDGAYSQREALVVHLRSILEPAKVDVRAFLSNQDLPEDIFKTATNIWNYLDRALKKAVEEL